MLENEIDLAPYKEFLLNTIIEMRSEAESLKNDKQLLLDDNKLLADKNTDLELKIESLQEALNNRN
ncbi:MAG: hypothetical protein ACRCTA_04815, partial [Bacilli bacterium]